METAAAMQMTDADNIICLLDDIANAKLKLDDVLAKINTQCALLRSNCDQGKGIRNGIRETWDETRKTWDRIKSEQPSIQTARRMSPDMDRLAKLTPRETEVLRLIAEGFSTKEIADRLGISFKTAVCHRTHVLAKANCHNSATLVRLAIDSGLVENGL